MSGDELTDMAAVLTKEGGPKGTKKIPMKSDPGDQENMVKINNVAGEELRQFIERYERLEAEKKDIMEGMKEVMAEAKGRGYNVKILRKIIALRKRDKDDLDEEEAVLEMYMAALGMS
jgi:uncharacterized protein (UPF0335 family)